MHVIFKKSTQNTELSICVAVNSDKLLEFLERNEAIASLKQVEQLRQKYPNVTKDGKNIGSKISGLPK